MGTIVRDDPAGVAAAAACIRAGGVVILPTDTVYGIFGNALEPRALERVYEMKQRDRGKPFMIHTRREDVARWAEPTPSAEALIEAFWPNPLGLLLRKREIIPDSFTMGLPTVGVMTNANHVMRGVVSALDFPVFGTTLNYSGEDEIRRIEDAARFVELVDTAVAADHISVESRPSSIVDCSSEPPAAIRISATGLDRLREVLPDLDVDLKRRR